jgi:hypothetical protein
MDWEEILRRLDEIEENLKESERIKKILPTVNESTIIKWIYYTAGKIANYIENYEKIHTRPEPRSYRPRYLYYREPDPEELKWSTIAKLTDEALHEFMEQIRRVKAEKVAVIVDRGEILSKAEYGDKAILKVSEFEEIISDELRRVVTRTVVKNIGFHVDYVADLDYFKYLD